MGLPNSHNSFIASVISTQAFRKSSIVAGMFVALEGSSSFCQILFVKNINKSYSLPEDHSVPCQNSEYTVAAAQNQRCLPFRPQELHRIKVSLSASSGSSVHTGQ